MGRPPLPLTPASADEQNDTINAILETVRTHFGMDAAYISEIVDGHSVLRAVSAPGLEAWLVPGATLPLSEVYCQHILEGRLPNLIRDTAEYPLARALPVTQNIPIGALMSLPVYREDGSVYGLFCCMRSVPYQTLTQDDLAVMEAFARLVTQQINDWLKQREAFARANSRINNAVTENAFHIAIQPVVDLKTLRPIKFEALSRFADGRPPNIWYDEARQIGRQVELEIAAVEKALELLHRLPADLAIGINASPRTIASGALFSAIRHAPPNRLIVEVTEHDLTEDYDDLAAALEMLRRSGIRTAVDDVGAGFSGLVALLKMRPDILKLDIELVRDIDRNLAKQSLVLGMVDFAHKTGAVTIAEGVETEQEKATLQRLKVDYGQGYLFARPMDIDDAMQWLAKNGKG